MVTHGSNTGTKQMPYGQDNVLDIQVGMTVRASDGQILGIVAEVAGFGSTHLQDASQPEGNQNVTQAQGGTGFLKVDRQSLAGQHDTPPLTVPFHSVQTVTADDGVMLNGAALGEARTREQSTTARKVEEKQTTKGKWSRRLTSLYKHPDDARVNEQESEELREEAATRDQHGDGETATYIVGRRGVAVTHEPEFTLGGGAEEQSGFNEEMKP